MPVLFLFIAMLGLMLMRVHLPFGGTRYSGRILKTIKLSFSERLFMQRVNMYAIGAFLLLTAVTGQLPSIYGFTAIAITQGILLIPIRCALTTEGVAISNVVFRPWDEFTGYSVERRRIRLMGREGVRGMALPVQPRNQQEVLPILRRRLEEAPARSEGILHAVAQRVR